MSLRPIRISLLVAIATISLVSGIGCNKAKPSDRSTPVIAFGDSLVAGVGTTSGGNFVSLLSQRLNVSILNSGRPGDTTGAALSRLQVSVLDRNPGIVIVLLGGNDLLQGIPIQTRLNNINSIVDQIRAKGAAVVLVGLGMGQIDPWEGALPGIATRTSSTLVPDILEGIFGVPALMFDSVHPNNAGHQIMADRIEPLLRPLVNALPKAN